MSCSMCHTAGGDPVSPGDAAVCETCTAQVADALKRAPELYAVAVTRLGISGRAMSERVSSSRPGSRSPLRDNILHLCDALWRVLGDWEAAAFNGAPRTQVRAGFAVQQASVALSNNLADALSVRRAGIYAGAVVHRVRSLRAAIGDAPLVHRLAAPCPVCDTRALVRHDGSELVVCRMCRSSWPESRYELLARAALTNEGAPEGVTGSTDIGDRRRRHGHGGLTEDVREGIQLARRNEPNGR